MVRMHLPYVKCPPEDECPICDGHAYECNCKKCLAALKLQEEITDQEIIAACKWDMQPGDTVRKYNNVETLCGHMGLALIRDGKAIAHRVMGIG